MNTGPINRKPLRVRIVKRREGSYYDKDIMKVVIADNVLQVGECNFTDLEHKTKYKWIR